MIFTKKTALRQLVFILCLFVVMFLLAIWDSNTQIKVKFDDAAVHVKSDKYTMEIPYSDISSAELAQLPDAVDPVMNAFDDDIIRTGVWSDSTWGDHHCNVDLDCSSCIAVYLKDGSLFVFSRKSDKATAEDLQTLQTYLAQ